MIDFFLFIFMIKPSMAANGLLLLGSILIFEYGIRPAVTMLGDFFHLSEVSYIDSKKRFIF